MDERVIDGLTGRARQWRVKIEREVDEKVIDGLTGTERDKIEREVDERMMRQ